MKKNISIEVRKRIISAYNSQKNIPEIAESFSYHKTTVKRITKNYLTEGRVGPKPKGGVRPRILMSEHKYTIQSYISENCSISL
jgi:transposase